MIANLHPMKYGFTVTKMFQQGRKLSSFKICWNLLFNLDSIKTSSTKNILFDPYHHYPLVFFYQRKVINQFRIWPVEVVVNEQHLNIIRVYNTTRDNNDDFINSYDIYFTDDKNMSSDKNDNANSTQSDKGVMETPAMIMCTTTITARIMVKQNLMLIPNPLCHGRLAQQKFAPEAAITHTLAAATNIFMPAAAVKSFYMLVCFLAVTPPLIMTAATIYLTTTNNMLIRQTIC